MIECVAGQLTSLQFPVCCKGLVLFKDDVICASSLIDWLKAQIDKHFYLGTHLLSHSSPLEVPHGQNVNSNIQQSKVIYRAKNLNNKLWGLKSTRIKTIKYLNKFKSIK